MIPSVAGARGLLRRLLLVAVVTTLAIGSPTSGHAQEQLPPAIVEGPVTGWPEPPEVSAEAWVLVDAHTGQVLAERHGGRRVPVASTVKVLTAMTVLRRSEPDDVVTVGDEVEVGGASVGLEPGDQWTVEELLDGLLVRSGNDAAEALAVHIAGDMDAFVSEMARDADELGLEGAEIAEASGLGDVNRLSPRDLATLARTALGDAQLRTLLGREQTRLPGVGAVETRNELLVRYPGATGVKTGYTRAAGLSLVGSARRDGRELIAVVLDSDEDPARFDDAATLLDHGFDRFEPASAGASMLLLVGGGSQTLRTPVADLVVPEGEQPALGGLPPARPEPGSTGIDLAVGGRTVGAVEGEVGIAPERARGTAGLGQALAGEAHAAMRAATATGAW